MFLNNYFIIETYFSCEKEKKILKWVKKHSISDNFWTEIYFHLIAIYIQLSVWKHYIHYIISISKSILQKKKKAQLKCTSFLTKVVTDLLAEPFGEPLGSHFRVPQVTYLINSKNAKNRYGDQSGNATLTEPTRKDARTQNVSLWELKFHNLLKYLLTLFSYYFVTFLFFYSTHLFNVHIKIL